MSTLRTKLSDLSPQFEGVKGWKKNLLGNLEARLGYLETEEQYTIATLLDPRHGFAINYNVEFKLKC